MVISMLTRSGPFWASWWSGRTAKDAGNLDALDTLNPDGPKIADDGEEKGAA